MTARTPLLSSLQQLLRRDDAVDAPPTRPVALARRDFLRNTAFAVGGTALASSQLGCALGVDLGGTSEALSSLDVGIVGAGMAGLACAYELKRKGVIATIHEASDRAGGRVWSMGGAFPGPVDFGAQVIERGGELIDTPHKTMIGYARELGLTLEDVNKAAGEVFFNVGGVRYSEAAVVAEYRALVDAMRDDLRTIGAPTADAYTDAERALDYTSLAEYLASRGAGTLIRKILSTAYEIEYGVAADRQSCLAFLLFIHADRRSRFQPWGVFSDERYHVVGGNQQIPAGLASRMASQLRYGRKLTRVRKTAAGRIELTYTEGGRSRVVTHDAVVLTLPFSVLRDVELDASLALPPSKTRAIRELVYGTNAKMMVRFAGRPWASLGGNGASFVAGLPSLQCTWETNVTMSSTTSAVLTDYTGGALGASLDPARKNAQVTAFLADLERVFPGASARAMRDRTGNYVAHIEPWPSLPLSKGSYTANHPGYFTTIADNEQKPVGNVFFAGEHTSSFYEWQGFMEGAALSGVRAAGEVYDMVRATARA